jgi:DNA-directed RNA polymerase sigma subunit (sigma70/sigma32)
MNKREAFTQKILLGCAVLNALEPGTPKTMQQIADACGVSKALIQEIQLRALRKLRHPVHLKQLKEFA